MRWEAVIGLEVHAQLSTRSKLFCPCRRATGSPPNTHVCPVCLGLPGALPVINDQAVRLAVRAALALGFTVQRESQFARKHYFYPDLPKGYQITQFEAPIATGGLLSFASERGATDIRMIRLHVEEDAGKSVHDRVPGRTAVDFNRAGTPLVEIVTEPDLRSPAEARRFLSALKQVLEYLEVSDCNMEEGHLRADANLSVRPPGTRELGVKQEIKNLNSFSAVERALAGLRDRQVAALERGATVEPATFSAGDGDLRVMREKEERDDYRYFPEPDLPPLVVDGALLDRERAATAELPAALRDRLQREYGVREADAVVLTGTRPLAGYYEAVVAAGADASAAARWIIGPVLEISGTGHDRFPVSAPRLAELVRLVEDGTLSNQAGKRVLREMAATGEAASRVARRLGVEQVGDAPEIDGWVQVVLDAHPAEVARYRDGEDRLLGFFMGEAMKRSGGKADPSRLREALLGRLG